MKTSFYHVWKYPFVLGVLTLFGLLAALTGTGTWHVLSWLALSTPLVVCIWFAGFPAKR